MHIRVKKKTEEVEEVVRFFRGAFGVLEGGWGVAGEFEWMEREIWVTLLTVFVGVYLRLLEAQEAMDCA